MQYFKPTHEAKVARVAAGLAISNLGHLGTNVKPSDLLTNPKDWTGDAESDVCQLAGHLMENDDHESLFTQEAAGWADHIKNDYATDLSRVAAVFTWHPWIKQIEEM